MSTEREWARPPRFSRERVETRVLGVLRWVVIVGLVVACGFPLVYMVVLSMRPFSGLVQNPLDLVPSGDELTLGAYERALRPPSEGGYDVLRFIRNTAVVALSTVALSLGGSILGAYAVARLRFAGRRLVGLVFFSIYLIPGIVMAIPLYVIFTRLGLRGSYSALVIIYLAHVVPVSVYMLENYFRAVPESLEEAAAIDGATWAQTLRKIVLPLARPAIVATSLYIFMIAWNEFLFALLFLVDQQDKWTISLGVAQLNDQAVAVTVLMAASVVLTLPVVIAFFFAERLLVRGLTAGAEKG
jgi:multiple sugar transport system permease protein